MRTSITSRRCGRSFLQTLTDPKGREIDRATGTLLVPRPGRFRWEIHPQSVNGGSTGAGQLMVGDGTNLWFYDRDLQQVTVKPVDAALSATPIMLLSGTAELRQNFKITRGRQPHRPRLGAGRAAGRRGGFSQRAASASPTGISSA